MSLSIRHWLAERNIKLAQLGSSAQIAGIAFRLAQDMEGKSLNAFAISALTDVLELPLSAARLAAPAISQLTMGLLRILSRKKPLKRNEGTWLTFQVAYLNALQGILEQEALVGRPWVNRAMVPAGFDADQALSDPQLLAILKTLRPGRLSDSQAEQALSLVADSFLVQQMNNLAREWFVANGAEETEAKLLTQRLSNGLAGYLLCAIAENPLPLAQLQKFVRLGNLSSPRDPAANSPDLSRTTAPPLNLPREHYRARLLKSLSEPLFGERFALKDLYIPLKGKLLRATKDWDMATGRRVFLSQTKVDLMEWAMSQLEDTTSIAVIEADPGSGKSSFCQIWAARVAQDFYPDWMPVVIRLKDVKLGQTFEQTLASTFPLARFTDTDGWLSPNSPPCLLILDGLDELPHLHAQRHLWTFMEQVARFHASNSATVQRHKIVITSSSGTLDDVLRRYQQSLTRHLPSLLQRIAIEPMGQEEFRQWFQNWAKLQSKAIAQSYFNFLRHGGAFKQSALAHSLAILLKRPLLLYLVGLLHRDAWVDETIFQTRVPESTFEIYDRICRWLLGEPATESGGLPELIREGLAHASRSQEAISNLLEGRSPQVLRHKMQAAALKIIQGGQYQQQIPQQLPKEATFSQRLPALFFRSHLPQNSLGLQSYELSQPIIEFSHASLGAYLAAEAIAAQIQAITEQAKDQYGEVKFVINSLSGVAQHLYSLLGYGILSTQIEQLVIERLRRTEKRNSAVFSFQVLFQRLYRFYRAYCRGRWLDEGIPQSTHSQSAFEHYLTVLQIDAAVGLNLFLLLCASAKEAAVAFYPCGDPGLSEEFDADQFLGLINRVTALSPTAFWQRARQGLSGLQLAEACLNQVMFAEVNLEQANLSKAELIGINLAGANLQNANLYLANLAGANLANANLLGANLEGADLKGANLKGANLTSANLTNACVFETWLDEPNQSFAKRSGAIFSRQEFQTFLESLAPTQIFNYLDDEQLEGDPTIFIESAEGELILPERHSDDEGETAQIEEIEQETAIAYNVRLQPDDLDETIRVSNLDR
ncbi:MAG: pentapeptide repeat-containing protein [Coleofasciculaceae cyanobacterium]